ncbi:MAG: AAA family ATPase [Pirellulales bacterium]
MTIKKTNSAQHQAFVDAILAPAVPAAVRSKILIDSVLTAAAEPAAMQGAITAMLEQAASSGGNAAAELAEAKGRYEQALREMENGPARPATFIALAEGLMPGPKSRIHCVTPDGQERFPFAHDDVKTEDLRPGMTLFLDAKGAVVLGSSDWTPPVGPQATFRRQLPGRQQVEVAVRDETITLYAAGAVLKAIDEGQLKRNDKVLYCPHRQMAFDVIPASEDRRHRFIDSSHIPDIVPSRDIGQPHPSLRWLVQRTRILMFRPDIAQRCDQRPRVSLLMTGPSGVGKTLQVKAFQALFAKMMVERTGRDDIGSRVIRVRVSEMLSQWLGEADKNWDALFDDIAFLASQEIETANGERIRLPITIVLEEIEGIARRRSEHDGAGGAYDRIMGTLLQRLDDPNEELSKLPIIIISTTNKPSLIDVAMHRRLGGKIARFHRLNRAGLAAVLGKKIKAHYPFASLNGHSQSELRVGLIDQVVSRFHSQAFDGAGQVEITLRDGVKLTRYYRDFMTGAVVEQALADCVDELSFQAERGGWDGVGLSGSALIDALIRQIEPLIENMTEYNASDYVDLPDAALVAKVRRLAGPKPVVGRLTLPREVTA